MDDWLKLPARSHKPPGGFFNGLRRPARAESVSHKIILDGPPDPSPAHRPPAEAPDPVARHLARLKQVSPPVPDSTGVADPVERMLLERRFGSAVELLKAQAESQLENFDVWLRYAEAHGLHCGNITTAEKIIRQMERSGNFKKAQLKKAYTRLKKWRDKHPHSNLSW